MVLLRRLIVAGCLAGAAPVELPAQSSPYLPERGQGTFTPAYSLSAFDKAWLGSSRRKLERTQHSGYFTLEYGITEWLAADGAAGHVWSRTEGFGSDQGWIDTSLGLRARVLEEGTAPLQMAVRAGVIIPGSYDADRPFAVGEGAWGVEGSLLLGRQVFDWFGFYGELGHRWREGGVPQDAFGSLGAYLSLGPLTVLSGYRFTHALGGEDLDPRLPRDFDYRGVRETRHQWDLSLSFRTREDWQYSLFYTHAFAGRNAGVEHLLGLSLSIPFGGSGGEAGAASAK